MPFFSSSNSSQLIKTTQQKAAASLTQAVDTLVSSCNEKELETHFKAFEVIISRFSENFIFLVSHKGFFQNVICAAYKKQKSKWLASQIVQKIWQLIKKQLMPSQLEAALCSENKLGFTVLYSLIDTKEQGIFYEVLALLKANESLFLKNIMHRNLGNFMPLHAACRSGSAEMVKAVLTVLQKYPDVLSSNLSNCTKEGFMPLQTACRSGSVEMVNALLDVLQEHPDVLSRNLNNCTPEGFMVLQHACTSGSAEIVQVILDNLKAYPEILLNNLRSCTNDNFMPLQSGCKSGNAKIVNKLLGVLQEQSEEVLLSNLSNCTKENFMPLQAALATGDAEMVKALLAVLKKYPKALLKNLESCTKSGFMPLQHACLSGSAEIVKELLDVLQEHPEEVLLSNLSNCPNDDYMPLQSACKSGNAEMVNALLNVLKKYPKVLLINLNNRTHGVFMPLQTACALGSAETVHALLDVLRAYPDALLRNLSNCTKNGFMPLQHACTSGNAEIIKVLVAILKEHPKALLSNLGNCTKDGFTPLQSACKSGNEETVKALLRGLLQCPDKKIIRLNMANKTHAGFSCLDAVVIRKQVSMVALLLAAMGYAFGREAVNELQRVYNHRRKFPAYNDPDIKKIILRALNGDFPPLEEMMSFDTIEPFAGINPKYLDENAINPRQLEELPVKSKSDSHILSRLPENTGQCWYIKNLFSINTPELQADFFTQDVPPSGNQMVTFICAGRKENALLPRSTKGYCVMVLTEAEFHQLSDSHDHQMMDLLVVRNLQTAFGPCQNDALHLLTHRRLAILLAANFWQLKRFAMLDDNISQVQFNTPKNYAGNDWDRFYQTLEDSLYAEPVISVTRHIALPPKAGQLGSKLFMINLEKIKERFLRAKDLTLLFPDPSQSHYWGEDYYFQLMLHYAFKEQNQGYRVLAKDVATLIRSVKNRNAFAMGQGKRIFAEAFQLPNVNHLSKQQSAWIKQTIKRLNEIIESNKLAYAKKQALVPEISLLADESVIRVKSPDVVESTTREKSPEVVESVTRAKSPEVVESVTRAKSPEVVESVTRAKSSEVIEPITREKSLEPIDTVWKSLESITKRQFLILSNEISYEVASDRPVSWHPPHFLDKLHFNLQFLNEYHLRSYQKNALQRLLVKELPHQASIIMAAGVGKTRVQSALACLGHEHLYDDQHIVIVTCSIGLVSQFYEDFQKNILPYRQYLQAMSMDDIIPVSCKHTTIEQLKSANYYRQERKVFIFCIDSLLNLLEENPLFLEKIKLLMLDEYHAYYLQIQSIIEKVKEIKDQLVLGFTATPPENNPLPMIYHYPLQAAINAQVVAPIVADCINAKKSLKYICNLIQERYHPGFSGKEKLKDMKGIVYLKDTKACNELLVYLRQTGVPSFAIHSDNPRYQEELEAFKQSDRGVILACKMCIIGFDDKEIGYVIITNHPQECTLEQMICRATRRHDDKIGYIITSDLGVHQKVLKLVEGQSVQLSLAEQYLQQKPKNWILDEYCSQQVKLASHQERETEADWIPSMRKRKFNDVQTVEQVSDPHYLIKFRKLSDHESIALQPTMSNVTTSEKSSLCR